MAQITDVGMSKEEMSLLSDILPRIQWVANLQHYKTSPHDEQHDEWLPYCDQLFGYLLQLLYVLGCDENNLNEHPSLQCLFNDAWRSPWYLVTCNQIVCNVVSDGYSW